MAAEEKDATVKVTVNGKEQKELKKVKLVEGDNTIVIEVTSPDKKEKKTYTFELEGKSVIYLSDLEHKNNSTNGWSNKPFGMDKTYEGNPIRLVEDEEQNIRTFEKVYGLMLLQIFTTTWKTKVIKSLKRTWG